MAETSSTAAQAVAVTTGPAPDPLLGRTINGRFTILSVLARGGMGKVYKAEQAPLGRLCALKVLQPNYSGDNDPEFHKRFFLEASIAAKLKHPHTVTVFDYGHTDDDVYFMAMELLEGRTLHRLIREAAPLEPLRAVHILLQTCRSLREAHALGVIHRDLKPANIFLIHHDEDADFVKVLDFGLVKNLDNDGTGESLTQTGLFMGSPKYMAPEQIRGERVSAATDVYALGVMLYEMLTGKVPFDRPNSVNVLMAHVSEPVPALREANPAANVPPALEELVYRCLSKRPEERFASMDELIAGLKAASGASTGAFGLTTGEYVPTSAPVPIASASPLPPRPTPSDGQRLSGPARSGPVITSGAVSLPPALLEPAAVAAPSSHAVVTPQPRALPRAALALAVVLLGLGVGVAYTRATARPPAPAQTALPPLPPPPPVPSSPEARVVVSLDSDPPGAEVLENGQVLGHTPLRMEWTGARGDPDALHRFTFRLADHDETSIEMAGPTLRHTARLQPRGATTTSPPGATRPPPAGNARRVIRRPVVRPNVPANPSTPHGYRQDPYGE